MAQAEGVMDLICAKQSQWQSFHTAYGRILIQNCNMRKSLIDIMARLSCYDYPEEDIEEMETEKYTKSDFLINDLNRLLSTADTKTHTPGIKVVIVGKPNVEVFPLMPC